MQLLFISGIFVFTKKKLFMLQIQSFIVELCLLHYIMKASYQQLCLCFTRILVVGLFGESDKGQVKM